MPTTFASTQSRSEACRRLAGQANTLTALLSTIDILELDRQPSMVATCADIARGISSDLDLLVGGVA